MRVTIVPVLAQILGVDPASVDAEFMKLETAIRDERGAYDSRTFALAVDAYRQAHPFPLESLIPARRALGDKDSRADVTRPSELTR